MVRYTVSPTSPIAVLFVVKSGAGLQSIPLKSGGCFIIDRVAGATTALGRTQSVAAYQTHHTGASAHSLSPTTGLREPFAGNFSPSSIT